MNSKRVSFIINAKDNATKVFKTVGSSLHNSVKTSVDASKKVTAAFSIASAAIAAATTTLGKSALDASMETANALTGLTTVARAFKQDADKAKQAAKDLASDGLMNISDAAAGLKNLLASGFGLDQAITLMNGFKDSAAFNRQASLGFGEAIRGATEGIKNQNSILVDNAGITKNLSIILKDAGFSAQDLGNVQSDINVRTAMYNGLLKEMSLFQGDAAKSSEMLTGQIQKASTNWFNLKSTVGDMLSVAAYPAIKAFNDWIASMGGAEGAVDKLKVKVNELIDFVKRHQVAVAAVAGAIAGPLVAAFGAWAIAAGIAAAVTIADTWYILAIGAAVGSVAVLIVRHWDSIKAAFTAGVNWIISKVNALISAVNKAISALNKVPGVDIKKIGEIGSIEGRASGGTVNAGQPYIVGEQGPEMFVPNKSGTIVPQGKSGGTVFNFVFNGDVNDAQKLVDMVKQTVNRELELSRYGIG